MPTDRPEPQRFLDDDFRQLLDTAPDPMLVVTQQGQMAFVNRQTEVMFGYPRAELLEQPLTMLIPQRYRGAHVGHVERFFSLPTVRGMGSGLELFGVRKDGSEIPIEVSLSPVTLGGVRCVSAAIRDISERKRIQAAIKLSADRLSGAINSMQNAFAIFDAEGRLVQCNDVYRELAGRDTEDLVGSSYRELLRGMVAQMPFDNEGARGQFLAESMAEQPGDRAPFELRTQAGKAYRVLNERTPDGGYVQTVWDLTEDMLRAEELRQARISAEAGSAAKSEFLSSMSHELRTPLNAVLGFAQLLLYDHRDQLSTRHRDRVEHIMKGGEHLLRLIDDMLDLARIEAGGTTIEPTSVDPAAVVREVTATLEPSAHRANLRISTVLAASVPHIVADRTRFVQILMNYGSNAIKYNRAEGAISFEVNQVEEGMVRVCVRDTGFGVPLNKQHTLFQPFQRAGQEAGPIEGTGIGLAISKRLAELMGGAVGFRSEPERGSSFWVDLPVFERLRGAALVEGAQRVLAQEPKAEGRGLVLYIEDNPANVSFMRDFFERFEQAELLVAPNAEVGLELARGTAPKLVLMDLNLPGMSGYEALRELRADPRTAHVPVVALTASASESERQRGLRAGFREYLAKPVQVRALTEVVERALAEPGARADGEVTSSV